MSLMILPIEILDMILAFLVPDHWNASAVPNQQRQFDAIVSRHALKKLDQHRFRLESCYLDTSSVKWLLTTKLRVVRGNETGLASAIWNSVSSIGSWRICNSEAAQEEEYLSAACDMLIASRGKYWVCGKLQTLLSSSACFPPLETNDSDDRAEILCPENQRPIEAMVRFHSLQLAAYHGDHVIVETLLKNGVDPNFLNEYFGSALYVAAYRGHTDIARLLIEHGAAINGEGNLGTALEAAAYQGHVETLRLLLDRWANVRADDTTTRCLFYASKQGHTQAVQLLLARSDVNVNAQYQIGTYYSNWRPRPDIISRDFEALYGPVIWNQMIEFENSELILSRQNIAWNRTTGKGETPLTAATFRGHEKIVRLLIERDDIDLRFGDREYCPLWRAVVKGHEIIVRLFLERYDISLDEFNAVGVPLFWWASLLGRADVVSLLLRRDDVNPSLPSFQDDESLWDDITPLFAAADRGHDEVVRIILALSDINPNPGSPSYLRHTPLGAAAERGYENVVASLLERQDTDPNRFHGDNAPLYLAAENGHEGIVRLLLGRSNIDLNTMGDEFKSETPLWIAVRGCHHSIVELLLSQDGIDPSRVAGIEDKTPFQLAAAQGCDNIVRQFLGRDDIDPNENNIHGTPLWQAASYDQESVMRLLLERADVDPNVPSEEHTGWIHTPCRISGSRTITYSFPQTEARIGKETPLSVACRKENESSVKLLLEHHRINPNIVDTLGRSSLWSAAFEDHDDIVQLLLDHPTTRPNLHDNQGWTPLLVATNQGHGTIVDLLLQHVDTDPNIPNDAGWTPLLLAAHEGNEGMVRRLLRHPNIKPDLALEDGRTPLMLSQKNQHHGIVRLLTEDRLSRNSAE
ncbi:hypothetical protein FHL15_009916 [Xylaria flabelliformis]|uniref:Uncharacterized protein n=1 Tax=Xylaria flabelliformis TaxID=2512241 RepID=A0A553HMN7_9PEZI|nr:hypothetical protein FHL15_009916 [Xylaria flabelliformis]